MVTPIGIFDAIRLRVTIQYDDEEFWRHPTTGNSVAWYSPAVWGVIREETDVQYLERGYEEGPAEVRTHHLVLELTTFVKGRQ